jgi:phage-related minor tail protein
LTFEPSTDPAVQAARDSLDALAKKNAEEGKKVAERASQERLQFWLDEWRKEGAAEKQRVQDVKAAQKAIDDAERDLLKVQEDNAREGARIRLEASKANLQAMLDGYDKEKELLKGILEAERQWYVDRAAQAEAASAQFTEIFTNNFADSVTDIVTGTKSVADAFKDMAAAISQSLVRIAAQGVAESIFGTRQGGGSATGDFFKGILGSVFGGARAFGGPAYAGEVVRVGERGPEYIMPMRNSQVVPAAQAAGATNNVSISVNVPATTERRSATQIAAQVGAQVGRAMRRNQ